MDEARFWEIVELSRATREPPILHARDVEALLLDLSLQEIVEFQELLSRQISECNHWDIRAAALLLTGSATDKDLCDFACWLILKGRRQFQAALDSAESIADCTEIDDDWLLGAGVLSCEDLPEAVHRATEHVSGRSLPLPPGQAFAALRGNPWRDDELPKRFPKLWSVFHKT